MPVSIPTNIAGISIPSDAVNGPLSALYKNKYELKGFKYPRDLGSNPSRNHVIEFTILRKEPLDQATISSGVKKITDTAILGKESIDKIREDRTLEIPQRSKLVAQGLAETTKATSSAVFDFAETLLFTGNTRKTPIKTINLYVPDTLNVNYASQYDDISITESLGKALFMAQVGSSVLDLASEVLKGESIQNLGNKIVNDPAFRYVGLNAVGNAFGVANLGRFGLNAVNTAINPQLQVLFRGVGFRTFQFDFLLTPYNQKEAQDIKEIIHAFKYHSAPEIIRGKGNAGNADSSAPTRNSVIASPFMTVPETFAIKFFYKGTENPNVNKIAECVLTNVTVDYAPSGWSTHNEGAPVQTRLSLQFQEIEIIDKAKIREGY